MIFYSRPFFIIQSHISVSKHFISQNMYLCGTASFADFNKYFILYPPQNNYQIPLKKGNGEIFKIVTAAYEYEQKTYVLVFWQQAQGAFPYNVEIQISAQQSVSTPAGNQTHCLGKSPKRKNLRFCLRICSFLSIKTASNFSRWICRHRNHFIMATIFSIQKIWHRSWLHQPVIYIAMIRPFSFT